MASRVDRLEKKKKKVVNKTSRKAAKAVAAFKDKKADKIVSKGRKKYERLTKKIDKSMARQEERGMRRAKRQKINDYTKGVKTSGMRKKAKKALGRAAATGAGAALGSAAAGMGKKMSK